MRIRDWSSDVCSSDLVVVGVALGPVELHPLRLVQHLHGRGTVVDEGVEALTGHAALGEQVEVAANRLAGVVVAPAAQCRVVGDPDAAAGDAGGAPELLRLLDPQDTQALLACGKGTGPPAAAGADPPQ